MKFLPVIFFLFLLACKTDSDQKDTPDQTIDQSNIDRIENNLFNKNTYKEALFWAKKKNKNVLIYFNGIACVNCGKYRSNNWTDENIILMDSLYEFVNLWVDDRRPISEEIQFYSPFLNDSVTTRGQLYLHYQRKYFDYPHQPLYVSLDKDGTPLMKYIDHGSVEEFNTFLKRGPNGHYKGINFLKGIWYNPEYAQYLETHNSVHAADSLTSPYLSLVFQFDSTVFAYHPHMMEADYLKLNKAGNLEDHYGEEQEIILTEAFEFTLITGEQKTRFVRYKNQNSTKYLDIYKPRDKMINDWLQGDYTYSTEEGTRTITFGDDYALSGLSRFTQYRVWNYAGKDVLIFRTENFSEDSLLTYTFGFVDENNFELREVENITAKIYPEAVFEVGRGGSLARME